MLLRIFDIAEGGLAIVGIIALLILFTFVRAAFETAEYDPRDAE